MHLSLLWLAPLVSGAVGATALTLYGRRLDREVRHLQREMMPLRLKKPTRPQ